MAGCSASLWVELPWGCWALWPIKLKRPTSGDLMFRCCDLWVLCPCRPQAVLGVMASFCPSGVAWESSVEEGTWVLPALDGKDLALSTRSQWLTAFPCPTRPHFPDWA